MQFRNYFILAKETANFCFSIHFSYLSVTKPAKLGSQTAVINRTHDIALSSCATAAQITTIITITTR
jgi:hypothetical protein